MRINKRNKKICINKGITLISLVITIIILLMLAGISISVLMGNEGIISKTADITTTQQKNVEKEILDQDLLNVRNRNNGKVPIDILEAEFDKNDIVDNSEENSENDRTRQIDSNLDGTYDSIEVTTKKNNTYYYDGEAIIGIDIFNEQNGSIDFTEPYTITFVDEICNMVEPNTTREAYPGEIVKFNDSTNNIPQIGYINGDYVLVGWKDPNNKVWSTGFYTQMSNEDVILNAQWEKKVCIVKVAVKIEEINTNDFKSSSITDDWKFIDETTIDNSYLSSDEGINRIENIINNNASLANLDLNKSTAEIDGEGITISKDDIDKQTVKYITINLKRNRYILTLVAGENIEKETLIGAGKYKAGEKITIGATATEIEGYIFDSIEWLISEDDVLEDNVVIMPNNDITVTINAKLKARVYTIKYYNLDEATVSPANPTQYTIEYDEILLNNPTRELYAFIGWTGTGLTTSTKEVKIPKGSTENREYTANWVEAVASATQNGATTYHATVKDAVNEIDNGTKSGVVTLLKDFTEPTTVTIPSGTKIEYDTGGKTLTSKEGPTFTNKGTLTVKGTGTIQNILAEKYAISNSGTLNANSGTITSSYRGIYNTGTTNVDGATISVECNTANPMGIRNITNGVVNVKNGKIQATSSGEKIVAYGIYTDSTKTNPVNVSGEGQILADATYGGRAIQAIIGEINVSRRNN